jgi:Uma2 family endonuclease
MSAEPVPPPNSRAPWPDHLLSLAEWDALPEDNTRHYELAEGAMFVTPRPVTAHQLAAYRLCVQLDDGLPTELTPLIEVEIVVEPGTPATVRAPDLIVVATELAEQNPARYDAADVLVAVEIISPGSRQVDRITKFAEYAEVGIEHYWIVDLESPVSMETFRLKDGRYLPAASGTESVRIETPTPVTIDVPRLTARRGA